MSLRDRAHALRVDAHAVWLSVRDPRTSWFAKLLGLLVTGYALSPIDLIPDFVPVLGLLDDAILIPIGIWLMLRLIPQEVFAEHRAAAEIASHRPVSRWGAAAIILLWTAIAASLAWSVYHYRYW
ncbi:YkvA family protein [Sphingoaurantiacus capsulatus]|uniref:YkvA family protein n=1 Tax=Sphingoaurantiacus capsulatus TaxID=1771310 RepID=A0ABV7XD02_9SPHN